MVDVKNQKKEEQIKEKAFALALDTMKFILATEFTKDGGVVRKDIAGFDEIFEKIFSIFEEFLKKKEGFVPKKPFKQETW